MAGFGSLVPNYRPQETDAPAAGLSPAAMSILRQRLEAGSTFSHDDRASAERLTRCAFHPVRRQFGHRLTQKHDVEDRHRGARTRWICIGHNVVETIKRMCRQMQTRYVPLRTHSVSSFSCGLVGGRLIRDRTTYRDIGRELCRDNCAFDQQSVMGSALIPAVPAPRGQAVPNTSAVKQHLRGRRPRDLR